MPEERIPIQSIISKLDHYLNHEDYTAAHRLLLYWKEEAQRINDLKGELEILNELMGFSRRINDRDGGISAIWRGFELVDLLKIQGVTAGTVYLNGATTLKCFGEPEKAVEYYQKAYQNFEHHLPKNDKLWGGFYNNYALALSDIDRIDEAMDCYQNAIDIMMKAEYGLLEVSVTLMNIAELFEKIGHSENLIEQTLEQALFYLNDKTLPRNGYYAFVCRKCAPTFGHFGWFKAEQELNERANRIYEGS